MDMRLFKRGHVYYIEVAKDKRKSLGITDKKEAQKVFRAIKKKQLQEKLFLLDEKDRISISQFSKIYLSDPDRVNLSDETLSKDELVLRLLIDVVGDIPLKLVNKDALKTFKTISLKRVKPVSVNSYLSHIKASLGWAMAEGYIDKIPQIKKIKIGETIPRYLSIDDIKKILKYAKDKSPEMYRIIKFALYTGCRRAEIIKARYDHIQDQSIRIYGKGSKERLIPLLPQALDIQKDIGKLFTYKHVSTLSHYFLKIVRACGVQARFHDLRHTAATQMLASGIDLKIVKEILGHADIRTTEIYAKVLAATMQREMKKLSYDK
jgi:integrase